MTERRVVWMRHGVCHDGEHRPYAHARPESALTARGAAQAASTAREMLDGLLRPVTVLHSPLPRAQDTARIVSAVLGGTVRPPSSVLAEWRAPSCVLGLGPAEYPPKYRSWREARLDQPDTALPGGESIAAFASRARLAVVLADEAAASGTVVVCSHRLLIGAVVALANRHDDPAALFGSACSFPLAHAGTWTAADGPAIRRRGLPRPAAQRGWQG